MQYKKYQQGDVVMLKVDDDYFKDNTRVGDGVIKYNTQSLNNPVLTTAWGKGDGVVCVFC